MTQDRLLMNLSAPNGLVDVVLDTDAYKQSVVDFISRVGSLDVHDLSVRPYDRNLPLEEKSASSILFSQDRPVQLFHFSWVRSSPWIADSFLCLTSKRCRTTSCGVRRMLTEML
jgi:hypothetical protein